MFIRKNKSSLIAVTAALILMSGVCLMLSACGSGETGTTETIETQENNSEALLQDCPVVHKDSKAGVYVQISIDDFNALGFTYGDSVDIKFSNGYSLTDIPYFSGYYVEAYKPLLVGYPGTESIKATINYGNDLWDVAGLRQGDTASICIHEKRKYVEEQAAGDLHYTNQREDYPSDAVFANFRNVTVGRMAKKRLYRSASPCDNKYNRAAYVDDLIAKAGVNCIIDLADSDEDIRGYRKEPDFDSSYFLRLYKSGNVFPMCMSMNFMDPEFQKTLVSALTEMSEKEGPYLVHCTEGKDRTGYVCMLLAALCGATYQEIVNDYMLTYDNYYGINERTDPEKYNTIKANNIDVMLESVVEDEDVNITHTNLSKFAKDHLIDCGMSRKAVRRLKERLTQ